MAASGTSSLAVVGRVSKCEPIDGSHSVSKFSVEDGGAEHKQVIAKTKDFSVGQKCVLVRPGTRLVRCGEGKVFPRHLVAEKTMLGVVSQGLCLPLSILTDKAIQSVVYLSEAVPQPDSGKPLGDPEVGTDVTLHLRARASTAVAPMDLQDAMHHRDKELIGPAVDLVTSLPAPELAKNPALVAAMINSHASPVPSAAQATRLQTKVFDIAVQCPTCLIDVLPRIDLSKNSLVFHFLRVLSMAFLGEPPTSLGDRSKTLQQLSEFRQRNPQREGAREFADAYIRFTARSFSKRQWDGLFFTIACPHDTGDLADQKVREAASAELAATLTRVAGASVRKNKDGRDAVFALNTLGFFPTALMTPAILAARGLPGTVGVWREFPGASELASEVLQRAPSLCTPASRYVFDVDAMALAYAAVMTCAPHPEPTPNICAEARTKLLRVCDATNLEEVTYAKLAARLQTGYAPYRSQGLISLKALVILATPLGAQLESDELEGELTALVQQYKKGSVQCEALQIFMENGLLGDTLTKGAK